LVYDHSSHYFHSEAYSKSKAAQSGETIHSLLFDFNIEYDLLSFISFSNYFEIHSIDFLIFD